MEIQVCFVDKRMCVSLRMVVGYSKEIISFQQVSNIVSKKKEKKRDEKTLFFLIILILVKFSC